MCLSLFTHPRCIRVSRCLNCAFCRSCHERVLVATTDLDPSHAGPGALQCLPTMLSRAQGPFLSMLGRSPVSATDATACLPLNTASLLCLIPLTDACVYLCVCVCVCVCPGPPERCSPGRHAGVCDVPQRALQRRYGRLLRNNRLLAFTRLLLHMLSLPSHLTPIQSLCLAGRSKRRGAEAKITPGCAPHPHQPGTRERKPVRGSDRRHVFDPHHCANECTFVLVAQDGTPQSEQESREQSEVRTSVTPSNRDSGLRFKRLEEINSFWGTVGPPPPAYRVEV